MPTIIEAIDTEGPLWFPGLAEILARRFDTRNRIAQTRPYLTSYWLRPTEHDAPRDEGIAVGSRTAVLENLTAPPAELAVVPARWRNGDATRIKAALALLDQVDGLMATLTPLVRAIHRLEAAPDYDISHSDPALPYSIFLSIPPPSATAAIRLAESILHEAMHLQLSLIEGETPLVAHRHQRTWSPWLARERPAQGVLHGLYVFAVIFEALEQVEETLDSAMPNINASPGDEQAIRNHSRQRRRQIAAEVRELPDFSASLEPAGERLRRRCLEAVLVGI